MRNVLEQIFDKCFQKEKKVFLDNEASQLADSYYDETVTYRMNNPFKNDQISLMSKSRGLVLRIAGVISLLRESIDQFKMDENNSEDEVEIIINPIPNSSNTTINKKDYEII